MSEYEVLDWDHWIPFIESNLNAAYHDSLGDTPYKLMYGRDKILPYELYAKPAPPLYNPFAEQKAIANKWHTTFRKVAKHLTMQSDKMVAKQHRNAYSDDRLIKGSLVMRLYRSKQEDDWKLCKRFQGPYRVKELKNNSAVLFDLNTKDKQTIKVALNDLKLVSNLVEEGLVDHGMAPTVAALVTNETAAQNETQIVVGELLGPGA